MNRVGRDSFDRSPIAGNLVRQTWRTAALAACTGLLSRLADLGERNPPLQFRDPSDITNHDPMDFEQQVDFLNWNVQCRRDPVRGIASPVHP
jgi:hypothetical protein